MQVIIFLLIGFFAVVSRVHLKLDSWLQLVHPSAIAPLCHFAGRWQRALIDYFSCSGKAVDQSAAHPGGDETFAFGEDVLTWTTHRLLSCVGSSDKICRVYLCSTGYIWKEVSGRQTRGTIKYRGLLLDCTLWYAKRWCMRCKTWLAQQYLFYSKWPVLLVTLENRGEVKGINNDNSSIIMKAEKRIDKWKQTPDQCRAKLLSLKQLSNALLFFFLSISSLHESFAW